MTDRRLEELRKIVEGWSALDRQNVFKLLRADIHLHVLKQKWNIRAETILEAIDAPRI